MLILMAMEPVMYVNKAYLKTALLLLSKRLPEALSFPIKRC